MKKEIIYPGVNVYRDLIEKSSDIIMFANGDYGYVHPWHGWYHFGRQTSFINYPSFQSSKFPSKADWDNNWKSVENPIAHQIANAFFDSTSDYVASEDVSAPNWVHGQPSLCMYESEQASSQLAMQYHTDFIMSESRCRGFKHWLTCNIYLNDNYEGGELSFKIFKTDSEYDIVKYKPKAGDVLVFPSHQPYYHGVTKTTFGSKYFVRAFWGYQYEGSPTWLEQEAIYGQEEWGKMEKKRIDYENKSSMWMKGYIEEH